MSAEKLGLEQPLDKLHDILDATGFLNADKFGADVGMPYIGNPVGQNGYVLVGETEENLANIQQVRGSMYATDISAAGARFMFDNFYVPNGESRQSLQSVGMPRFRNEGSDYKLRGAPVVIRSFGVSLDFSRQVVGITARPTKGVPYRAEFDARECRFPDHMPVSNADIAYKIGVAAVVTVSRKYHPPKADDQ